MIRCLYISPADGWAIVNEAGELYLLNPPYRANRKKPIERSAIRSILDTGGFEASDQTFDDYLSAINYLDSVVGAHRSAFSPMESAKTVAIKALAFAKPDQVRALLSKIGSELEISKDFTSLEEAVLQILNADISKRTPTIIDEGLELIKKIGSLREGRRKTIQRAVDISAIYPYCTEKYGVDQAAAFGAIFANRRSMFAF